jgi:hypothetical protein
VRVAGREQPVTVWIMERDARELRYS